MSFSGAHEGDGTLGGHLAVTLVHEPPSSLRTSLHTGVCPGQL